MCGKMYSQHCLYIMDFITLIMLSDIARQIYSNFSAVWII